MWERLSKLTTTLSNRLKEGLHVSLDLLKGLSAKSYDWGSCALIALGE